MAWGAGAAPSLKRVTALLPGKGENSPFLWRSSVVPVQPTPLLQDKGLLPFTPQAPAESTQTRLDWAAAAAVWVPSADG